MMPYDAMQQHFAQSEPHGAAAGHYMDMAAISHWPSAIDCFHFLVDAKRTRPNMNYTNAHGQCSLTRAHTLSYEVFNAPAGKSAIAALH